MFLRALSLQGFSIIQIFIYHHKLQSTVCETCSASLATTLNMIIRGCVTTQHLSLLRNVPQITHGKQIGNRNQSYWKNMVHWVKQTVKSFKFSLWKIIKYCPCSVRRECFSSSPQVLVIALFLCTDYSLSVRTCPLRGWFFATPKITFTFPKNYFLLLHIKSDSMRNRFHWLTNYSHYLTNPCPI